MRHLLLPALLAFALPAPAETLSQEIARSGLATTEARLLALPSPSDADMFALGGVQFLRAIEGTFQTRYALGMTDRTGMLPLLRLPLTDNPTPAPFDPGAIAALFREAGAGLAKAQKNLTSIPETADFGVEIALADLWFDVDTSGTRSPGEGLGDILGSAFVWAPVRGLPEVRFDVADAAWLAAYADLLGGICALVQAYDPTEPIARVLSARAAMERLGPIKPDFIFGGASSPDGFDIVAIVLETLNQTPDAALAGQAKAHFRAMIAENRRFWTRVATETDNDREWLPNDNQQSALGIHVPPGTGKTWLAVLDDLDAALTGEKLVPHWRVGGGVGVDVGAMFDDPRPIDLAGWIHGWAALPYLRQGRLLDAEALNAFERLTAGQAPLFALYLN